jgi:hypothetical protein
MLTPSKRLVRRFRFRRYRPGISGFGLICGDEIAGFFLLVGPWAIGVQICYEMEAKR